MAILPNLCVLILFRITNLVLRISDCISFKARSSAPVQETQEGRGIPPGTVFAGHALLMLQLKAKFARYEITYARRHA